MNREELIELAKKIQDATGQTEADNDELLDIFMENVPDPHAANYFFDIAYNDLTAEEIVDKSLSYKPFQF
ncbi:hypothetical protein ACR777_12135 [Sphingobacterium spiritivorum]|uniref:hypothetical protein n=1 Tax=Sphingobacterium spiritivorum TaxID=258 RepID=UPI003DA39ECB